MHRIDSPGNVGGLFSEGTPGIVEATELDADWFNAVQEELANTIEDFGGTLVKGTNDQLSAILALMLGPVAGGRLTLTSGTGVTTTDVTAATTVYYTPHAHARVVLYDGTRWNVHTFAEMSQTTSDSTKSPAAVANSSNYDVFAWNDAGTLRATRGPAWSSDTARGTGAGTTELEFFQGRWVNKIAITNGPAARRGLYLGTIRSDGSAQVNDSAALRHVWNMFNRVARPMRAIETATSWDYTTLTLRQANANTSNQLDCVIGMADVQVSAEVHAAFRNSDANGANALVGVGLDSTSALAAGCINSYAHSLSGDVNSTGAAWKGYPGIGRHYITWLEASVAVGTTTWSGDEGDATLFQSGIHGELLA